MKELIKQLNENIKVSNEDEIFEAFDELRETLIEFEDYQELTEAKVVDNLSDRQIRKLFRAASAITRGQSLKGARTQNIDELKQKMTNAVKSGYEKLSNANPIENFEQKAVDIINKWKGKLDPKDKVIDAAKALGRYGRDNPGKSAFVLGVLGTLTSALGTPAFGAAASTALNTAMELAKKA